MGDFVPGGICHGGFCRWLGDFVTGDFVAGGFCHGAFCHGGFCHGRFCRRFEKRDTVLSTILKGVYFDIISVKSNPI